MFVHTASVLTTLLIQNITNHAWICNSMVKNIYKLANFKFYQFYGDITILATAFFQNLLASVISINNIYNAIQT